ncbi:hypothetical protein AZA_88680 [Nitrospirillum viridazoti Y2]|nr:hypothetical protein AZA_88680 [Nitrospirillum amazonense Y2]
MGLQRLGRQGAAIGDGELRVRRRRAQPVPACDDSVAVQAQFPLGLLHLAGGEAQVEGAAVRPLHVVETPGHDGRQFIDIGGLIAGDVGQAHADQRRGDGLVRPALRRQGDARGGGHHHEAGVLVGRVVHGVQAALDEGVVERADGQQPGAEQVMAEAQGRQHEEQVVLGDTQLDVLAAGRALPALGGNHLLFAEDVLRLGTGKQAAPVHPGAQVGGHGDVRGGGDDSGGQVIVALGDLTQNLAEPLLRRHAGTQIHRQGRWHGDDGALQAAARLTGTSTLGEGHLRQEGIQRRRIDVQASVAVPFLAVLQPAGSLEGGHLVGVHQAGMIVLVSLEGQTAALDRIGDETGRAIVGGAVEGLKQGGQVMARQVGHEGAQSRVVMGVKDVTDAARVAQIVGQRLAPGGPALEGQRGIQLVGAGVDPLAQGVAALLRERGLQLLAVLQDLHVPVQGAEHALDGHPKPVRHHAVQALAVVVDDPPGVAQVVLPSLQHGFEDVALVHLGVAHQGHHAALRLVRQAFQAHIVLHQGGEGGDRHPQANGTGRKIDVLRVLGARGVALRPAQGAEALQLLPRLAAQHVLDGVEDGAGVRLHRHPVLRPQHVEIQRRHDAGQRSAGGLVAAHLQPIARGADVVGVVDGPGRQPEHLALQRLQQADLVGVGDRSGGRGGVGHTVVLP